MLVDCDDKSVFFSRVLDDKFIIQFSETEKTLLIFKLHAWDEFCGLFSVQYTGNLTRCQMIVLSDLHGNVFH